MAHTFEMTFTEGSYDIYNAVYAVVHVFHEMNLQIIHNLSIAKGKVQNYVCNKVVLLILFNISCYQCL